LLLKAQAKNSSERVVLPAVQQERSVEGCGEQSWMFEVISVYPIHHYTIPHFNIPYNCTRAKPFFLPFH